MSRVVKNAHIAGARIVYQVLFYGVEDCSASGLLILEGLNYGESVFPRKHLLHCGDVFFWTIEVAKRRPPASSTDRRRLTSAGFHFHNALVFWLLIRLLL